MHTLQQLRSGQLAGITRLRLSCGLTEFPKEIYDLADTLEILDLSQNGLSSLPDDFPRLTKLRIVFLSDNLFTRFPEILSQCAELEMIGFKANQIEELSETALPPKTRWLILTNNRLKEVPRSIGKCYRMQKLMLAGNQLRKLPDELSQCKNLGLFRISANQIEQLPDWLWEMPRLSWLAISNNPCHQPPVVEDNLMQVPWSELELKQQLGEGASGIISKAIWYSSHQDGVTKEVAVKVFKGEVTSDGLPADEMNACIAAGNHPDIVKVLGEISEHPDGKKGLVLGLIPPEFTNLAGPPSLASCTRDVFAEGTAFPLQAIFRISRGIADAVAHLHQHGIMHGDLYAHNTLIDPEYFPLFGDFGGATLYERNDAVMAARFERLEISAFGCLLDDLLQNASPEAKGHPIFEKLEALRDDCINTVVANRPFFTEVVARLEVLQQQ